MILFAPAGLAGLILMHRPIVAHARASAACSRPMRSRSCRPRVMARGAVLLLEMSYRLATQPELGTRMRSLWIAVDAATPWPWLAAVRRARRRLPAVPRDVAASRRGARVERARARRRASDAMTPQPRSRCATSHKSFGATPIIRGVSLDVRARRAARDHRPERRRQVDAVQPDQRPLRAHERLDPAARRGDRGRAPVRDQPPRPGAELPGHQHLSAPVGVREHPLQRAVVARATATASGAAPTRSRDATRAHGRDARARSASRRGATCPPACSPTPSSARSRSASRSPAARDVILLDEPTAGHEPQRGRPRGRADPLGLGGPHAA